MNDGALWIDPAFYGKCSLEEGTEANPVSIVLNEGSPSIYSDKASMFEPGCDTSGPVNTSGSFGCKGVEKIIVCENINLGQHGEGGGFLASKMLVYNNLERELTFDHLSTQLGYSTRGILPAQSPIPNERTHIVDALNLNAPGSATENCDPRNGALDASCKENIREALMNYSSPAGAKATKRPANRAPQQIKFQVGGNDVSLDSWFANQRGNPNRNKGRCMFIDCATPEEGGGSYNGASPGQACSSTSDCETNSICLDSGSGLKCYNNNLADSNSRIDFDICDLNRVCQDGYSCSPVGATEYNACVGSIGGIGGDPGGDPEPTPGQAPYMEDPTEVWVSAGKGGGYTSYECNNPDAPHLISYFRGTSLNFAGQTINAGDRKCVSVSVNGPCNELGTGVHWGSPWLGTYTNNCPAGYYCGTQVVSDPVDPGYDRLSDTQSGSFPLSDGGVKDYACRKLPADYYTCDLQPNSNIMDAGNPSNSVVNAFWTSFVSADMPIGSCARHFFDFYDTTGSNCGSFADESSCNGDDRCVWHTGENDCRTAWSSEVTAAARGYWSQSGQYTQTLNHPNPNSTSITAVDRGHIGCRVDSDCATGETCRVTENAYGQKYFCE
jgi:hypothetical protein